MSVGLLIRVYYYFISNYYINLEEGLKGRKNSEFPHLVFHLSLLCCLRIESWDSSCMVSSIHSRRRLKHYQFGENQWKHLPDLAGFPLGVCFYWGEIKWIPNLWVIRVRNHSSCYQRGQWIRIHLMKFHQQYLRTFGRFVFF